MLDRLDHVAIAVQNLAAAQRSYVSLLGRSPSWRDSHPLKRTRGVRFLLDNSQIELATPESEGESERAVWSFMAGRGGHEKTLSEVTQHVAFGTVATNDWDADSAWQLLSAVTHNLVRQFQIETGAALRPNGRKRTYRFKLPSSSRYASSCSTCPRASPDPTGRAHCASPRLLPLASASARSSAGSPRERHRRYPEYRDFNDGSGLAIGPAA